MNQKPSYFIDLLLTKRCQFRCTYCYEHDYHYDGDMSKEVFNTSLKYIRDIANKSNSRVHTCYWGGEPTLKPDYIIEGTNTLKDVSDFLIFTNGYNIDNLKSFLLDCNKKRNEFEFFTQISYDYSPNQEINRICPNHNPIEVRDKVLDSILWSAKNKINFSTKSTINVNNLKNIYDVYMDFQKVKKEVVSYSPNLKNNFNLVLTLDTCNMPTEKEFNNVLDEFKEGMTKILKYQIQNKIFHDFSWMNSGKELCSVGHSMVAIGLDGSLYPCHGCVFSNISDMHKKDINIFNYIDPLSVFRKEPYTNEPEKCKKCDSCFCMRCNIHCSESSQKENYDEKMCDFGQFEYYCKIYKEVSKYIYAKNEILKGE